MTVERVDVSVASPDEGDPRAGAGRIFLTTIGSGTSFHRSSTSEGKTVTCPSCSLPLSRDDGEHGVARVLVAVQLGVGQEPACPAGLVPRRASLKIEKATAPYHAQLWVICAHNSSFFDSWETLLQPFVASVCLVSAEMFKNS